MPEFTIALAGNPNSGKSTLFNALTGARQHVGNYPGITVEKKEGSLSLDGAKLNLVDLPGTYSLTSYSLEERVARRFLAEDKPDAVIGVLNAGVLERNLYLAVQILELGAPLALGLNMMDEAEKLGFKIDASKLSKLMGLPVVKLVAKTGQGVQELARAALKLAEQGKKSFSPLSISYGPDLDPVLDEMSRLIEEAGLLSGRYPARWVALKYLEADEEIIELGRANVALSQKLLDLAGKAAGHLESTLETSPEAVIADYRYGYISGILRQGVLKRENRDNRVELSDKLDSLLTHRFLGPMMMLGVLYLVYQITFTLGKEPMDWIKAFFTWLSATVRALLPEGLLQSLLTSGIIDGVGGVLVFIPPVVLIFLLIAFLEDTGYMARVAYMLDRVFRIFGLHGCSVMPFVISGGIGGGCAVPGVMAARTLRSPRERLATVLTAPFFTCGAKLPVFILLTGVVFPDNQARAMFMITLFAWGFALVVARFLRSTLVRGAATPFVMELPPYRLPTLRGLLIHTWERTWQYFKKAGTMILAVSILVWAAMTFPGLPEAEEQAFEALTQTAQAEFDNLSAESAAKADLDEAKTKLEEIENQKAGAALRNSAAGKFGQAIEKVSLYAGFDWRTNIALLGGLAAKEVIISTLGTAYSLGNVNSEENANLAEALASDPGWSTGKGLALIIFVLIYAPCLATVVSIARESGSWKWAAFSLTFNTVLAFGLAVTVYQASKLLA